MVKQKNICDVGQSGQTKYCKCGHLKDEHFAYPNIIVCTFKGCDCKIEFKEKKME